MTRIGCFREVAAVLLLASAAVGNGGPVDMSMVVSTGNLRFLNVPGVELLSEELNIAMERDHAVVRVVYRLENHGATTRITYGFPVETFDRMEWEPEREDFSSFRFTVDGVTVAPGQPVAEDTLTLEIEGMEQSGRMVRSWRSIELDLAGNGQTVVEVDYRVRPCFMDWSSNKSAFVSYSHRYFRYLLDPSGNWGDGTVQSFRCTLDFRELLRKGGEVISLPGGGDWIEPGLYRIDREEFDLASAPPMELVYDVTAWKWTDYVVEQRFPADSLEVVSSSPSLPPSGEVSYRLENLFDGRPETAWALSLEENPEPRLTVDLRGEILSCVALIPGYARSRETWTGNARIRSATVTVYYSNQGYPHVYENDVELPDTDFPEDIPMSRAMQVLFSSGEYLPVDSVTVRFTGVYPGAVWNDLCVSELILTR